MEDAIIEVIFKRVDVPLVGLVIWAFNQYFIKPSKMPNNTIGYWTIILSTLIAVIMHLKAGLSFTTPQAWGEICSSILMYWGVVSVIQVLIKRGMFDWFLTKFLNRLKGVK